MNGPCCATCAQMVEEPWPKGKTALRCDAPGPRQGRVTAVVPKGVPKEAWCRDAPAWCHRGDAV